jgi:mono/diheme cytochrome c family protein
MMMNTKNAVQLAVAAVALGTGLVACTKNAPELRAEPNVELIQDMMEQPALKPQDFEPYDRKKASSRLPPENTVPQGYKPYPYHMNPQGAEAALKNPLAGNSAPEVLSMGRGKFETYCAVCHGYEGKGDGPVAPKMLLKPPSLVDAKVVNYNDARIYHIITDGQGVMASYAYQIVDERDRWAIVNYIRSLQKLSKGGAPAAGAQPQGQ